MRATAGGEFDHEEERIRQTYRARIGWVPPGRYSLFEPGHLFLVQQRQRKMLAALKRLGLGGRLGSLKILEVGCGEGFWLRDLIQWGAAPENIVGIDLIEERARAARRLCPPRLGVAQASVARLPFPSGSFDLALQATVFTSILDEGLRRRAAAELLRVLKGGGVLLWYDYRVDNPWNPDVRGVGCGEIRRLFPGCGVRLRSTALLPPLARRLAPLSWTLCQWLEGLPFLCTHWLGSVRKP